MKILMSLLLIFGLWGSRLTTYSLTDKLIIESFDPQTKEGIRVTIPPNFEIESMGGRGKWWVGKIQKAGDKTWLTESIAWHFGLGRIYPKDEIFSLGPSKKIIWKNIDIVNTGLADKILTADNQEVWVLNSRWYKNDFFQDSVIAGEKLSVAVANTTSYDGLGAQAARIVELAGMRTTMLETTNTNISEACILTTTKSNQKKQGVKFLVAVFGCSLKIDDSLKDDVKLELGQKLALRLFG